MFQADESYVFLLDEPSYGDLGLEIRDCCGIAPDETDYNDNLKEFSFKKGSFVSKHSTKCVSYREEPIRYDLVKQKESMNCSSRTESNYLIGSHSQMMLVYL